MPPNPTDFKLEIIDLPETTMAVMPFNGICTDQEIERQTTKLLKIIEDGKNTSSYTIPDGTTPKIMILQYNAPGTLAFRRRNEIAVVVTEAEDVVAVSNEASEEEGENEEEEITMEDSVEAESDEETKDNEELSADEES